MPDNSCVHVPLKEFVETKIVGLKDLIFEKLDGRDDALKLQAKEYERRLEDLNHAHGLAQERNAEYVTKEKFEYFQTEFRQYKETNDKAVEAKAKSAADAVDQKATALKREFDEYKRTQENATNLITGGRQQMGKIKSGSLAIVGAVASLMWAASLGVQIYTATHASIERGQQTSALSAQVKQLQDSRAHSSPTPTP